MTAEPDTITLTGQSTVEVAATHAHVFVSVRGASSFGADQALAKAREVVSLVAALQTVGIPPDRVELVGLATESRAGRIATATAAVYRLKVRTANLDQLPLVVDAVGTQRNAGIDRVEWRYPENAGRDEALSQALARARAKAEVVAGVLGVQLQGIHRLTENAFDQDPGGPQLRAMSAARAESAPALDLEVMHNKQLVANVEVTYRIG